MGDCISECGFGCLIPRKNFLNYHLALASIGSAFLGIMGCVSFNNAADSINNAAWMDALITRTHEDGSVTLVGNDYLFGLSGYATKLTDKTVYSTVLFSDGEKCTEEFCDTCQDSRSKVLAFLIAALLFGFFSFATSLKRTFNDSAMWKTLGILASLGCCILGAVAYNMHKPCYDAVLAGIKDIAESQATDVVSAQYTYEYGSGAQQVLISFIIAAYICAFNLLIPVASSAYLKEEE